MTASPIARPLLLLLLVALAGGTASGCLFLPGREKLELVKNKRADTPSSRVVFRRDVDSADPLDESVLPLSRLRESLAYWSAPGSGGRPRHEGVLEAHPENLHREIIERIDAGEKQISLVSFHYESSGLDYLTLVDYYDASGGHLGYDYVPFGDPPQTNTQRSFVGYDDMAWWEYPQLALDFPVYLAIGLKELAGEIVKSPLSAIDVGWVGTPAEKRNPLSPQCFTRAGSAFVEDWRNGWTALTWRFRARSRHTPIDLVRDLAGAVPLVGPVLDHKSPPPTDAPPQLEVTAIGIGQGIHSGDATEQFTRQLERAAKEAYPSARVIAVPYRHGAAIDVAWSLLNLSSGMGYDAAACLLFEQGVNARDGIDLIGFSGSAQRFGVATRALRLAGVPVRRVVGVAGPVSGFSCARESYQILGDNPFHDPVLLSTHGIDWIYSPFGSNYARIRVEGAGGHHMPFIPHPATRAPRSGYRPILEALWESDE